MEPVAGAMGFLFATKLHACLPAVQAGIQCWGMDYEPVPDASVNDVCQDEHSLKGLLTTDY